MRNERIFSQERGDKLIHDHIVTLRSVTSSSGADYVLSSFSRPTRVFRIIESDPVAATLDSGNHA